MIPSVIEPLTTVLNEADTDSFRKSVWQQKLTQLPAKKRPGIYLPDARSDITDEGTTFIHEGVDESWSDGCIVLDRTEFMRVWSAIPAMNKRDVEIVIEDKTSGLLSRRQM